MRIKCIYIPRSTCFIYLWVPLERHSNTWAVLDLWYSPMGLAIDTKEKSVSKQRVSKISNFKQAAKWEFSSLQFKIGALVFYLFTPYIYTLLQQIYNIWTLCCVGHYKSRYQTVWQYKLSAVLNFMKCNCSDATWQGVILVYCGLFNSVFRNLWSICYK